MACRRALIVEDEYVLADDMAQALQNVGAQVIGPTRSSDEALALLGDEPVDAAVPAFTRKAGWPIRLPML